MRKYFKSGFQEIRGTHPAPKREPSCDVMSGTRAVGPPGCVHIETCALCGLVPRRV